MGMLGGGWKETEEERDSYGSNMTGSHWNPKHDQPSQYELDWQKRRDEEDREKELTTK